MRARVLCAAAAVFLAGCAPSRPSTPEDLLAKLQQCNAAGETGKIWDLLTPDAREAQTRAIDRGRQVMLKNPGMRNLINQYKCTYEEFMRLPYVELYRRENLGNERVLEGAKIVDKQPDPRRADETISKIVASGGLRIVMRARHVEGGWELVELQPQAN